MNDFDFKINQIYMVILILKWTKYGDFDFKITLLNLVILPISLRNNVFLTLMSILQSY